MNAVLKPRDEIQSLQQVSLGAVAPPSTQRMVDEAWKTASPFWPLKNLVAVNPLQGLEGLPFEQALREGMAWFEQNDLPTGMHAVNRETIKWCQAFFDDGQATLPMPFRRQGLFMAWKRLAVHDQRLGANKPSFRDWLLALPEDAEQALEACLEELRIPVEQRVRFMTLMLTTLPGWAAHIKYRTEWCGANHELAHPVSQAGYLAMRLATTCLLWPEAARLLDWHSEARHRSEAANERFNVIGRMETEYRRSLLRSLSEQSESKISSASPGPAAQWVFCIDVRSEPFRRALEAAGPFETLGFAGFFGVPVSIEDSVTGDCHDSCPVLLEPDNHVVELHENPRASSRQKSGFEALSLIKRLYQSVKYTFTTPFSLVEFLGPASGTWMLFRSLFPGVSARLKEATEQSIRPHSPVRPDLSTISLDDQCRYALNALRTMGLTKNFAPMVVLCGHGSSTQNNAFATALDCGACGGRHGGGNARILAAILNDPEVRASLAENRIQIGAETTFVAAEHNTTTDEILFFEGSSADSRLQIGLQMLHNAAVQARNSNAVTRAVDLGFNGDENSAADFVKTRSVDWAQVRPEWGLARNAAFIAAPRELTRELDLEGRAFLHSYDFRNDPEGTALTVILTAPMVVAQWINAQYLFSTLNNVAYGGGSKVTKNITGKLGIMQGNASDLMHGLPLQSVNTSDTEAFHSPQRLTTIVNAPVQRVDSIIADQEILQKLFGNGWVTLICLDPADNTFHQLNEDLSWHKLQL